MPSENQLRSQRWQRLVEQIESEYQLLPGDDKIWIGEQLSRIEALQLQLDQLFVRAQGEQACASCLGGCCAKGHNHMTLANLLGFAQSGSRPPIADFTRSCPFLAEAGCLLPVPRRPYNCISFVCDRIEENLIQEELERFYTIERRLRILYQQFAERYTGAAMTGLLIQALRLGNRDFLNRKPAQV